MNEYEGKLEINLSASVTVKALNRADGKEKLEPLQKRIVEFLRAQEEVDDVFERRLDSYVYTGENWNPTPRLNDERYLVYENEGDRDYFEEYYDGDETRIEDAVRQSLENELELLEEIEVGEIYFKERYRCQGKDCVDYRGVFHQHWRRGDVTQSSDGDLSDAIFAFGVGEADCVKIYVDMRTGALMYDFGMRVYELVEAKKHWEKDDDGDWECEYRDERKLGPKVYAFFMGQDAADEAFKRLNEGVE